MISFATLGLISMLIIGYIATAIGALMTMAEGMSDSGSPESKGCGVLVVGIIVFGSAVWWLL